MAEGAKVGGGRPFPYQQPACPEQHADYAPAKPSSLIFPREAAVSFRLSARTCLAAGLVCLQTADLICTYYLLAGGDRGDVYEANPVARSILATGGWLGVAAYKFAITAIAVLASLAVARSRPAAGLRLLAGLCLMMLCVNGYSAVLLASPDTDTAAELQAQRFGESLDGKARAAHRFNELRVEICDAVLDGECDTAEGAARMAKLIQTRGPSLELPPAARLPEPSRSDAVMAYLKHHLHFRAEQRGMAAHFVSQDATGA